MARQGKKPESDAGKCGRPSSYSDELAEKICARIAEGESLRKICRDEQMPSASTVFAWLADEKHSGFRSKYTHAREVQAELMAEDLIEIADSTAMDTVADENGEKPNPAAVARDKLRVETRKWIASKLLPKKYGDKVSAELSGPDGGPIQTEDLSGNEIARRIAFALAEGLKKKEA